ncbi:hypothetical protein GCM10011391_26940 [Pullulanibacillus camelliae]|uniref:Competence protein ComGF n=1 Tax=Pullulanibacillus camelliae TaxID=1707096 RepID=A0A8J2YJQ0_9BACL|nr:competence type IV pilus minor pilin ComGF [Pullulanibacillus camelliae]GGE46705.1 hypothetical protein GCM10011391_26940 [Pullulanibacillus camelliae]
MRRTLNIWQQQQGYTLLSTMIALSLLYMISALIMLLATITFHEAPAERWGRKDIWLFMHQFQKELESGQEIQCEPNDISFQKDEDLIDYRQSGMRVLRTLNHSGYEIALNDITEWTCASYHSLINVKVRDKKGTVYRWSVENMVK